MSLWKIVVAFLKNGPTAIIHTGILNILLKNRSSSNLNLIFMNSFPCLIGLPPLIVSA